MDAPGSRRAAPVLRETREVVLIHLETSFLIRGLVPGTIEDRMLRRWLRERDHMAISAIAWAEFLCGPADATIADLARSLFGDIVPFDSDEASLAAQLFNESGRRRGTLIDCMVAATALRAGSRLATSNVADFRRFEAAGLSLMNL